MVKIGLDIANGPKFMSSWLVREKPGDLIQLAQTASDQYNAVAAENASVSAVFSDSVLQYDLDGLAGRLKGKYRWFFTRFGGAYRQECQTLSQFTNTGKRPRFGELKRAIPAAISLRGRREWIASQETTLREQFGPWYSGYETDWVSLKEALAWAKRISKHFAFTPPEEFITRIDDLLADQDPLRLATESADHCVSSARTGMQEIKKWFSKDATETATLKHYESTPLLDFREYASHLLRTIDDLASWTRLIRAVQSCTEAGVTNPVLLLLTTDIAAHQYVHALESRVLTLWLDHWIGKIPVLRDFEAGSHAHRIEEFRKLDIEQQRAARRTLVARLAERRPHPSAASMNLASSQPALLMKEAKKKRRHKPLRRLFAEIPDLLVKIKPCMMMSPLSVSQFLPVESVRFDAVIFDEASQVKPEDAIGAIMRGHQIIVVGDNKQLPPTTFFDVSMTDDLDEDDYYENDTGAFESILDLCGTVGLPERMLQWHYRSRREGLIAFSNKFLYNNSLVTFPAPDFDGTGTGVEFRYLADGVYDRSRTRKNAREVQEILKIVQSHAREYPDKSLGVVTFSQAQMTAIDMALWRLRSQEPALESFFTNTRAEPFFVKNLENVQGDERDVMVFSVGYGRDATGKFTMNFGPLNKTGGERRLNVAVTRAREKVILVSSIRGADIDVSRSQAQGVQLLKHYLDYAERGVVVLDTVPTINRDAESESAFEDEVARVIENLGYRVDKQVGCSGFRIDLAIVDPAHPGRYALGIECDGASYHSAATARERDRLREQVLTNLGWRLHRIWSTDWFRT
ncbi:MAG: AAA domain-containing protein, partial [Anaerolineae bacterium]